MAGISSKNFVESCNVSEGNHVQNATKRKRDPDESKKRGATNDEDVIAIECDPLEPMEDDSVPEATFTKFIKTEKHLRTITGISSFKVLDCIVKNVEHAFGDQISNSNIRMNLYDQIVMAYMKLKQNCSFALLSVLFKCPPPKSCREIFYETVNLLSETLKVAIMWPPKDAVAKNVPKYFEGFEDVKVVVDSTEIRIKKPSKVCAQIVTRSQYKLSRTCKMMIGVAPEGSIIFISKPFGGGATDPEIFRQSKLEDLLESGDAVMVDRAFVSDDVCEAKALKFIRPLCLKEKKKLTGPDAVTASKIAKARVYVKRLNQRIKKFEILKQRMPNKLIPYMEDMFIIVCATINLNKKI